MSRTKPGEVVAIGVDIVEISKVDNLISFGKSRLRRVFDPSELAYGMRVSSPASSAILASIFAAKEAVFKALGRGWGQGVRWNDICLSQTGHGRWSVTLAGEARRRLKEIGGSRVAVSLGASGDYALAQAIVFSNPKSQIPNPKNYQGFGD